MRTEIRILLVGALFLFPWWPTVLSASDAADARSSASTAHSATAKADEREKHVQLDLSRPTGTNTPGSAQRDEPLPLRLARNDYQPSYPETLPPSRVRASQVSDSNNGEPFEPGMLMSVVSTIMLALFFFIRRVK